MPRFNIDAWLADPTNGVAIVGATGWVGRAMVDAVLAAAPDLPRERLRLFAGSRRPLPIGSRAFETETLDPSCVLGPGRWLIVHAGVIGGDASVGGDARRQNDALLERVLTLSASGSIERLVHVSSGAARHAGVASPTKAAYAQMKRDHEEHARAWSVSAQVRLLLPRIFNLGGPHITCAANYALGDFILRLSRDRQLSITTADPVFRSYVHVLEMARVVLDMALDETEGDEPFDVGGAQVVEIGELAREVARMLGLTDAAISRPDPAGGAGDWYVGDGRRYQTALFKAGRAPQSLQAIVADTIDYLVAPR